MPNPFFQFKQFTVYHDRSAMKVTTDACLFGAWVAEIIGNGRMAISNEQPPIHSKNLLDIGTGTGLLSMMVAQKGKVQIDAMEIDAAAAGQAKENILASPWGDKITVIQQDVLQWQASTQYDYIISNPPFYENELKSANDAKNIAHHDEGLQLSELFHFIKNHLKENGCFFLLLPAKREKEIEKYLQRTDLFLEQKVLVQQTLKHQPFRLMIQGRCNKIDGATEAVISIKNEAEEYTPAFISLLKDYYMYL